MREQWRKGKACESASACLEMRFEGESAFLRSSTQPETVIELSMAEWRAFRESIMVGDFVEMS